MIITCSKLITCNHDILALDDGALVFSNGIIQSVGRSTKITRSFPGHRILRLDNAVLMPGLVNTHSHLELPPLLDDIRSRTFPGWVLNLIRAKKDLNQTDYSSAAYDNINTLVHTGTTTVGEICTHEISPSLLKQSGLRTVVFREVISMGPLSSKFKIQNSKLRNSMLVRVGISPHSPYTVSKSTLLQIRDMARQRGVRLAMHIAESKDEVRLLQRKKNGREKLYQFAGWDLDWAPTGHSSIEYLDRIGLLSPDLLAVHAVQTTDKDIDLIKRYRVSIAHCPRSNKETGVGRMRLKKFLDAGITVGLGTDSLASSPSLNMWDEMRYAYRIHKRDGITPRDIFLLATTGGAKALGLADEIGTIEPGKKADLIAVPLPKKNTGDIYSDLLRETKSCIMSVVNGKILYSPQRGW
jgi:5-methylthioadenosine/S-adenosylhomocysteine deaminase